jgi:hypothetical protein
MTKTIPKISKSPSINPTHQRLSNNTQEHAPKSPIDFSFDLNKFSTQKI